MKNDPYFKLIATCIAIGLILALVSTHVHAAVPMPGALPLPPVHVLAKAPQWQMVMQHPAVKALQLNHAAPAATPTALPPALPAPVAVNLHLGF